jgi:hypothetical protein
MKQELESYRLESCLSNGPFPTTYPARKLSFWLPLLLCAAAIKPSLHAQTLIIDRQITGIVHHFTPPDSMFDLPGSVTAEIQFDTTGLTNVDLDQYQTFKLRLFAPAGQKIVANHGESYRSSVSVSYGVGADSSLARDSAVLEFEDFVGTMPTRDYSFFGIGDNGNRLHFIADEIYPAGGTEFAAMSYSFTATFNPANSPKDFIQFSGSGIPVSFSYQTTATTDPGPFVILTSITPGPEIGVEQPVGVPLADAGSSIGFGPAPIGYSSLVKTFTVRSAGTLDLTLSSVTLSGGNAGDFTVDTTGMASTVAPAGNTTFTVTFTPTGPGARSTTLQIFSNDEDENPFDIALTGTGLSFTADSDGDGLNDASEFQLAALGFNWELQQTELVNTYYNSANGAGLFTPAQVQALHIDTPLIQRNGAGLFTLTLGLQKSATLLPGSFVPFSFNDGTTQINGAGKIDFQFSSEGDAAFFRLETN